MRWRSAASGAGTRTGSSILMSAKFFDSVPVGPDGQGGAGRHHARAALDRAVRAAVAGRAHPDARRQAGRSGTAVPLRGQRFHPCSPTCSCTTRSTPGWNASSRPCGSSATPTTRWCTALQSGRPGRSWPPWRDADGRVSGWELHPDKTKIVIRKDRKRRPAVRRARAHSRSWAMRFRARKAPTGDGTSMFAAFLPAVSKDALKRMSGEVCRWRIKPAHHLGHRRTRRVDQSGHSWLDDLLRQVLPDRGSTACSSASTPTWCAGHGGSSSG